MKRNSGKSWIRRPNTNIYLRETTKESALNTLKSTHKIICGVKKLFENLIFLLETVESLHFTDDCQYPLSINKLRWMRYIGHIENHL